MFKHAFALLSTLKPIQLSRKSGTHTGSSQINIPNVPNPVRSITKDLSRTSTMYGGRYLVAMIIGSGTGPELMQYVEDIFDFANVPVDFEKFEIRSLDDITEAITAVQRNGAGIKSNLDIELNDIRHAGANVLFRQLLDLHFNHVHFKPYSGLSNAKFANIDISVIRQNTEGEYAMLEHESGSGVIESLKIITRYNTNRLAKRAYQYAEKHGRKKVTIIHKANIMKLTDGLFLNECTAVGKAHPNIKTDSMLVDNCCMQLVNELKQFDVMIMPNLYGSIIVNIISGMLGGPALYAGCDYGPFHAVFEPAARNIGLDIAKKNVANPTAMLNAAVELLYYLKLDTHAKLIDKAIVKTLCEDKIHTPDIAGKHTSTDIIKKIKDNISAAK